MPFTVIVLKKVPNSLRGDLTRWMQEISTGVYVGNYNSKVREYLWKRVIDTAGQGEALMCFSCRNELGYSFCTSNSERQVVDYDNIPLVLIPVKEVIEKTQAEMPDGYSNASRNHSARRVSHPKSGSKFSSVSDLVFLDIETTGLDVETDTIIEIGAVKISDGREKDFHRLIRTDRHIPEAVRSLTGITDEMLKDGSTLEDSLLELTSFIKGTVLVGYNLSFDIKFLNYALEKMSLEAIHSKSVDLLYEAKRKNSFQENYKFETTLRTYGVDQAIPHRALEDAKLMYKLYQKMSIGY